jgi:hypothetical protein
VRTITVDRDFLYYAGLLVLAACCLWSPICYQVYRAGDGETILGLRHFVLGGFIATLVGGSLTMCGHGWKRLLLGSITLADLMFWWVFSILAGW